MTNKKFKIYFLITVQRIQYQSEEKINGFGRIRISRPAAIVEGSSFALTVYHKKNIMPKNIVILHYVPDSAGGQADLLQLRVIQ